MSILNPEHLLQQAQKLIVPPPAGPPRQVDIRRAMSAAYYAVFHAVLAGTADQFVGVTLRSSSEYGRVYRAIDHKALRKLCDDARKKPLPTSYARHLNDIDFGPDIVGFATAVLELQDMRHTADYDPMIRFKTADALSAIQLARAALARLKRAPPVARKSFLSLLLFPPRR